jgi:hypothetical protein
LAALNQACDLFGISGAAVKNVLDAAIQALAPIQTIDIPTISSLLGCQAGSADIVAFLLNHADWRGVTFNHRGGGSSSTAYSPSTPYSYAYEVVIRESFMQNSSLDLTRTNLPEGGSITFVGCNPETINFAYSLIATDDVSFPASATTIDFTNATVRSRLTFSGCSGTNFNFTGTRLDSGDRCMRAETGCSPCYIDLRNCEQITSLEPFRSAELVNGEIDVRSTGITGALDLTGINFGRNGRINVDSNVTEIVAPNGTLRCYLDLSGSSIDAIAFLAFIARIDGGINLAGRLGGASSLDLSNVAFGEHAYLCLANNNNLESINFGSGRTIEDFLLGRDLNPTSTIVNRSLNIDQTKISVLSLAEVTLINGGIVIASGTSVIGSSNQISVSENADLYLAGAVGTGELRFKFAGNLGARTRLESIQGFDRLELDLSGATFVSGVDFRCDNSQNVVGTLPKGLFGKLNGRAYIDFENCSGIAGVNLLFSGLTHLDDNSRLCFSGCTNLTGRLDLSQLRSMGRSVCLSFADCSGFSGPINIALSEQVELRTCTLNFQNTAVTNLDFSNLVDINNNGCLIFSGCEQLQSVNLQNLSHVYDSGQINLSGCTSLTSLILPNLSNIYSNGQVNLSGAHIPGDLNLNKLRRFNWGGTIDLRNCTGLTVLIMNNLESLDYNGHLYLSGSSITSLIMFYLETIYNSGKIDLHDITTLQTVDLHNLNTISDYGQINLSGCTGLASLNLSTLSHVCNYGQVNLSGCTGLTSISLFNLSNVYDGGQVNLSGAHIPGALNLNKLRMLNDWGSTIDLRNCTGLTELIMNNLKSLDYSGYLYLSGSSITSLIMSNLETIYKGGEIDLHDTTTLQTVVLSNLNTISDYGQINLSGCTSLTSLGLYSLSSVYNGGQVNLSGCTSLASLSLPYLSSVYNGGQINLSGCTNLASLSLPYLSSVYNGGQVNLSDTHISGTFDLNNFRRLGDSSAIDLRNCIGLTGDLDLRSLRSIDGTLDFGGCTNITSLCFSEVSFRPSDNAHWRPYLLFSGCTNLVSVTLNACNIRTDIEFSFADSGVSNLYLANSRFFGSRLGGKELLFTSMTGLTAIDLTGCVAINGDYGVPYIVLHPSRQGNIAITNPNGIEIQYKD